MSVKEMILDSKHECMSRDEMAALQGERLVDLVNRVYNNVPFYTKKMKELGVEPGDIKGIEDIVKLPFTTKEDLRNNYPFGLRAVPQSEIVRVQGTSGTTGKLTIVPYTQKDIDVWAECVGRCMTMAGLTKEDVIHVCYGYGLFTGGLGMDFGARRIGAMTVPMSAGNTQRQIMCMEDFGATALTCTPSYALHLAETITEMGKVDDMKLKVGMNSYRFAQLNGKGGIWEGQQIPVLWESKVAMGREKGTIQNMMIDYITNVKKGKIDGQSHNRWEIIGLN